MTRIAMIRFGIAILGLIVWSYGAREDIERMRWLGIGIIVVAFLLRFVGPRPTRRLDED